MGGGSPGSEAMVELTGATFGSLIRDLAEEVGLADYIRADADDNKAGIPEDPHDLDAVKRAVNRGYDRFLRHSPRWTFLIRPVRIVTSAAGTGPYNVGGDPARYRLPSYITARPMGNWRYIGDDTRRGEVINREHQALERALQANDPATGEPLWGAVREYDSPDTIYGAGHAFQAIFYPIPDATYTLEADFRVRRHLLVDLHERTIAGPDHDRAILDCARHEWWSRDAVDPSRLAVVASDMAESLARSIEIDNLNRPRNAGPMLDPGVVQMRGDRRTVADLLDGAVSYNGIDVSL